MPANQEVIQLGLYRYGSYCELAMRKMLLEDPAVSGLPVAWIKRHGTFTYVKREMLGQLTTAIKVSFPIPIGDNR